jgi:alpha-galactosidase
LNRGTGVRYTAQLAWSGNWEMSFERYPRARPIQQETLRVELGMRFDGGQALTVPPGVSFRLPQVAFTAVAGDLDEAANRLHRYQRQYVVPHTPANDPLLVQFNSWYPFPGKMTVAEMKRCADIAAELGAEVFVLDAGWFNKKDWSRELGDWQADPVAFPNGLEELAQYVRDKRMRFGLWVEIENLGADSQTFAQHPEWCLSLDGRPIENSRRYHLDFARPEVRQWARSVIDRLMRDYQLGWLKIDYNIDIGEQFDPPDGGVPYRHLTSYYAWLDELRAAYPDLVIENCSSGGMRFDLGILAHTHTTWLSDEVRPLPSLQLGYGCTLEFLPEVCNHWMVGDNAKGEVLPNNPPGWWDFLLRVPMNGQYGISSRVFDWSPELKRRAAENIALYKRLRTTIMGADVYHLTPQPVHDNPTGWMALQYAATDRQRSVLMAYRLGASSSVEVIKLRGLDQERVYQVKEDGRPRGAFTGRVLSEQGLPVKLEAEWRAAVIELEVRP